MFFLLYHLVSCEVVNLEFSSSVQGDGVTALMHAAGEDHADAVEAIWHPAEMSEFGVREKWLGPAQGFHSNVFQSQIYGL